LRRGEVSLGTSVKFIDHPLAAIDRASGRLIATTSSGLIDVAKTAVIADVFIFVAKTCKSVVAASYFGLMVSIAEIPRDPCVPGRANAKQ